MQFSRSTADVLRKMRAIYRGKLKPSPEIIQQMSELVKDPSMNLLHLLPMTLNLHGQPMDVANRRPLFAPVFRKEKRTRREIYKCSRQVSKTTSAAGAMMMNLIWRMMFRVLYVAPLAIYTNRLHHIHLQPMMRTCRLPFPVQDKFCVNNVNEKTFVSGSHFHGVSCYNSPGNALGLAIDWIVFDEIQDLNLDFIPQIRETTRTSDFGWESYFGTARGIENTIQVLFDDSSKGEWFTKCTACGLWVIPTAEKHALSMIQKKGIACPDCSALLDVENGEWVHEYPSRLEDNIEEGIQGFAGYHIPVTVIRDLINPYDRYIRTIYDKLHGVSKYPESKFFQEVLGISSDQGGRPITAEEIRDASILDIEEDGRGINLDKYVNVAGGQDWGGSEITSFTVGTLVGLTVDGVFEVLGATRPTGIPDNERHLPVAAWYKKIGQDRIRCVGGDAGFVGSVQNKNLEAVLGRPVASIGYGTMKHLFKAVPMSSNFILDRTTIIFVVYSLIKMKLIRFPKGSWFQRFSEDLKAVYVEETESPTGIESRRYARYRAKADDFLHSLGYAIFVCAITAPSPVDLTQLVGLEPNSSISARTEQQLDEIGEESEFFYAGEV